MIITILISGRGSNMRAIVGKLRQDQDNINIRVLSNRAHALGVSWARKNDIPVDILGHQAYKSREDYDSSLVKILLKTPPRILCLAGFGRILSRRFFEEWTLHRSSCPILNIHPSLLPRFKGRNAQKQALDAYRKDRTTTTGCTVHHVTEDLDSGPIINKREVEIKPDDTVDSLSQRILVEEHKLYPSVIQQIIKKH